MPLVDAYASEPHYADHLLPVWEALDPDARGCFWTNSEPMHARLAGRVAGDRLRVGRPGSPNTRLTLVASFGDLQAVRPRPVALVEHGSGQGWSDGHPSNPGGRERGTVALFLCPNESVAARNWAAWPLADVRVVGSPRLDELRRARAGAQANSGTRHGSGGPVVCVSFHWDNPQAPPESRWAFDHWRDALGELAAAFPGAIGHAHPRAFEHLAPCYVEAGIEPVRDFADVVRRAIVYVADNSSTIFEAAALGVPVVLLDHPAWRRDVEHGLRFWTWADIGPRSADPQELVRLVRTALADPEPYPSRRLAMLDAVYPLHRRGGAAERAARAVEETAARLETDRRTQMSSTDPYAAPGAPPPPLQAAYDPASEYPERRLRRLGASDEQIADGRAQFAALTAEERVEALNRIAVATDDELRRTLAGETTSLDEPAIHLEEEPVPDGTVEEVLAWVGDDLSRGLRARTAETQGKARKTLIEVLERMIG